jgi:glycosyltransferase involved in cell wall biosynthesis
VPGVRVGVLVEQCLAPVPGGTGRYARELAAALAATAGPGDRVAGWCAWHRDIAPAAIPGVSGPHRLPLPRRLLAEAWRLGAGPGLRDADVLHAPTLLVPPVRRGQRLVVTIHDAVPWTHPATLTPRGVRWHRAMAERAVGTADVVVVPTEAVAAELVRYLPPRPGQLHVIGEGVADAVRSLPPDAAARGRRLGLPDGGYLLTLATLEPRKGLDVALAALARPEAPGVPLLVAGRPGWGGVDLAAQAARLGLPADRVRLLGHLGDADLAVVLARASALLMPSRSEGFGLPVVEALAHGVPAVVTDVPALVEVAGGPGSAAVLVVPVEDAPALARAAAALVAEAADPVRRARREQACRAAVQHRTWGSVARTCWQLYRSLAGSAAVARVR